ncbi:4-hydroxybenzoate octaprenyltransferase [Arenicella xantha]|uniref:4-hydroxybenzoate octaprenyltransferase n=1 Tax=Arenicella xantha TaxID=644221 RepID=A0A395JGL9_9GAMM|nr:4-hydroxybenzoate octaprenyltransferase [Arenicella xantha]RBP48932.1 4-hydroxybenzoate polyprenyltransferase [Arenicella xantha]
MTQISHYLSLMRFDKPIGWLLLMWPTLLALWIASAGQPSAKFFWIFSLGVIVMRSAGCVINDIADRNFDPLVERTQSRPIAAGQVSVRAALLLFVGLGVIALGLLLLLPMRVWPWSIPAVIVTIAYPFMKRFIQAPQLVLGIAFSFGIPMVYVACDHPFDLVFWLLVLSNFLWVLVYDTAYAMSDREDDLTIGVKSSAIYLGEHDRTVIGLLQVVVLLIWLSIMWLLELSPTFLFSLLLMAGLFVYQQWLLRHRERQACFQVFLNNAWVGGLLWVGLLTAF